MIESSSLSVQKLSDILNKEFPFSNIRVVDLFSRTTISAQVGLVNDARSSSPESFVTHVEEKSPMLDDFECANDDEDILREITKIWKTILGAQTLDVLANFFDVGGHRYALVTFRVAL
jgi:hypothetical protein